MFCCIGASHTGTTLHRSRACTKFAQSCTKLHNMLGYVIFQRAVDVSLNFRLNFQHIE